MKTKTAEEIEEFQEIQKIQELLDRSVTLYRLQHDDGKPASYIPELAKVDSTLFSLSITMTDGVTVSSGDRDVRFSLQSISKIISLAFALETFGEPFVFSKVGMEPCAEAFNSIIKLEMSSPTPLNPFINSGAITLVAIIEDKFGQNAPNLLIEFMSQMAGKTAGETFHVNERIYRSEASTADRNRALTYFMRSTGVITSEAEDALDPYFKMCSVEANTEELSAIGATIANGGINPRTGRRVLALRTAQTLTGLMMTCGLYNESGEFAVKVGIPAKSGVCGGLLAAVPGRMGVSVFSPPLDTRGNSVAGMKALEFLSQEMNLRGF
jgi:glutaminase